MSVSDKATFCLFMNEEFFVGILRHKHSCVQHATEGKEGHFQAVHELHVDRLGLPREPGSRMEHLHHAPVVVFASFLLLSSVPSRKRKTTVKVMTIKNSSACISAASVPSPGPEMSRHYETCDLRESSM